MESRLYPGRSVTLTCVVAMLVGACAGARATTAGEPCAQTAFSDQRPALTLSACPLDDSLQAGDSLRLFYVVRNNGGPVRFANNPHWFSISIADSSGHELPRVAPQYEEPTLGRSVDVTLPRGGFIGGTVNTSCARDSYREQSGGSTPCDWSITLPKPGTYTVTVTYASVPPPTGSDSLSVIRLQAKPFRVTMRGR